MMFRADKLPPTNEPEIRQHCEGEKSELVMNALTVPQVGFIVCRGCGTRLEMSGFNGARYLLERLVKEWNCMCEIKGGERKCLLLKDALYPESDTAFTGRI